MKLNRISELARKYTHYDMIQAHTMLPDYPDSRAKLLYLFLKGSRNNANSSELFALVTSLVQMAMDTHDLIQTSGSEHGESMRSKQLKVLAGDYFSSRFYHLLAQEGRIDLIGRLSHAICEVNRIKMNVYQRMKQLTLSAEEYIRSRVKINSELFLTFSEMMEDLYHTYWPEILEGFANCEVLLAEIDRSQQDEAFRDSWGYWYLLQSVNREEREWLTAARLDEAKLKKLMVKYEVRPALFKVFEAQAKLLKSRIEALKSENAISELMQLIQPFLRYVSQPKMLEEI